MKTGKRRRDEGRVRKDTIVNRALTAIRSISPFQAAGARVSELLEAAVGSGNAAAKVRTVHVAVEPDFDFPVQYAFLNGTPVAFKQPAVSLEGVTMALAEVLPEDTTIQHAVVEVQGIPVLRMVAEGSLTAVGFGKDVEGTAFVRMRRLA